MKAIEILLDGSHGQYIPQIFAEQCSDVPGWTGVSNEDLVILLDGPDNEEYWDTWNRVLDYAVYNVKTGEHSTDEYTLWQDGDLFAVCAERMNPDEYREFFDAEPAGHWWEQYAERNNLSCYRFPAYWASTLINGDASDLEDGEEQEIDDYTKELGFCVGVSEPFFASRNDVNNLGGDVRYYLFQEKTQ